MKKSIWFLSKYASPPGSQGGQRAISLTTEFVKAGHVAAVITSSANHFAVFPDDRWRAVENGFQKARVNGVTMLVHNTVRYRSTASLGRVMSWLHFEWGLLRLPTHHLAAPTHLIVSSLSLLTILNGCRLARKYGAKLVFEIRDIWPLTLQTELGLSSRNFLVAILSAIEKFGYQRSAVVVGTMPNLEEHVRAVAGVRPRVETIPLGIDEDLMSLLPKYLPPPKRESSTIVGYFGSIGRTNSIDVLLNAARQIGEGQHIEFHFWGAGDLLGKFEKEFASYSYIRFHGQVTRKTLFSEVAKAHVLFLATDKTKIWRYGQSLNKLLEYMLLGRPIIASYSGFPSMINEAGCGIFVPAEDSRALADALKNFHSLPSAELERLGRDGREWVLSNRTYSQLAMKYLALLE